jgi:hypothetical protein
MLRLPIQALIRPLISAFPSPFVSDSEERRIRYFPDIHIPEIVDLILLELDPTSPEAVEWLQSLIQVSKYFRRGVRKLSWRTLDLYADLEALDYPGLGLPFPRNFTREMTFEKLEHTLRLKSSSDISGFIRNVNIRSFYIDSAPVSASALAVLERLPALKTISLDKLPEPNSEISRFLLNIAARNPKLRFHYKFGNCERTLRALASPTPSQSAVKWHELGPLKKLELTEEMMSEHDGDRIRVWVKDLSDTLRSTSAEVTALDVQWSDVGRTGRLIIPQGSSNFFSYIRN